MNATSSRPPAIRRIRFIRLAVLALLFGGAGASAADFAEFRLIEERNIFNPNRQPRVRGQTVRRESRPANRVDTITLVGIMSYEKGPFAFFDGSRSEYRKVVQPQGSVGSFQMLEINPKSVRLANGSNEVVLAVGRQLRREDEAEWQVTDAPESAVVSSTRSYSSSSSSTRPAAVAPPGPSFQQGQPNFPPQPEGEGVAPVIVIDPNSGAAIQLQDPEPGATNGPAQTPASSEDEILRRLMERREQEMNR